MDQKTTLCAVMGKEMMHLCVDPALGKFEQIKVPAPPEIARLREDVAQFRQSAKDVKKQITEAGSAGPKAEESGEKQGMLAAMASKAQAAVEKVVETGAGVVAGGAEAALNGVADSLEKVVNTIEEPFMKVGKEVVEAKKDKINAVFKAYIGNLPLAASGMAVKLVRGEEPTAEATRDEQYAKVPPDALTDYLCRKSAKNLVAQLMPVCEEEIKNHMITKTWNQSITTFNGLCDKIAAIDFAKENNLTLKPIELDINDYIVSQCVEQIALLMAKEEAEIRKKPNQNNTFDIVFSGGMITDRLFNQWSNAKGPPK